VERSLTDALIGDVLGEPGGLPLLSASLVELWRERDGRVMRHAAYERTGGVRAAVGRLAEHTYTQLSEPERRAARGILMRLAAAGEEEEAAFVRRRLPFDELDLERDDHAAAALAALTASRLVTTGEGAAEVAHEALLREWPRLRAWLEEDAESRRLHQHLIHAARDWQSAGRDPGELYRGARLASALDWATNHDAELNDVERAFLDESRAASGRAQRRLRAGLVALAALLVLAVIAGLVALDERGKARDEAVASDAQRLGALALLEDDLDRALLLARQGVALDDTVQTRGNLLAALLKSPAAIGVIRADTGRIEATALSPDERTLAVGTSPGRILLFNTPTRQRVATLRPTSKDAFILNLAYSPDGSRLAVAHIDHPEARDPSLVVTVLHVRSRRSVAKLTLSELDVSGMQFSPDGRTLAIMTLRDWPNPAAIFARFDASTGRRVFGPVRVNRRGGSPLLVTSDGRRIVVVGEGEVTLRDATTLAVLRRFSVDGVGASPVPDHPDTSALSSDDHTLAVGDENGSVRLLDLRSGKTRTASGGHEAAVREAQFAHDGRRLITTGEDGDVIVWNVRTAAPAETLRGHAGSVFSPQITRDGRTLFTASRDGTVLVWDLGGARRLGRPFRIGAGHVGDSGMMSTIGPMLSSDGRLLARGRDDGNVIFAETDTLKRREPLRVARAGWVSGIGFVPGSHLFMVGGRNGLIAVVDIDRRRVVRRLRADRRNIYGGSISAAGRLFATVRPHAVRLWSLAGERPLGSPLRFPSALVGDAQLSPDGRRLAILLFEQPGAGSARTLEVWDVRSRRVVARKRVEGVPLTTFSPDGRLLAVGDIHGRARVWSTDSWEPVTRWFAGHTDMIAGMAIGRDGRTLATGGGDGTVRLWDIETEQAIGAPLPGLPNVPVWPLFTPDGTQLIAAYESGDAYRWDIRPESLAQQACRVAGRRLTGTEWTEFLPGRDYDPAC
jgi:WD40 repeat protein